jgi:two-component system, NarL family, response regulator
MTKTKKIRIQIADDHTVVRDGLAAIVGMQEDMVVVAQSADGAEALRDFAAWKPDVLILDLRMPVLDGVEVVRRIMAETPSACILIVTTYQTDEDIFRCLKDGARGYILKDSSRETIVEAVREVALGHTYTPALIATRLVKHLSAKPLTPRELEVLQQVSSGLANKQIADALGVSEGTIKTHLKSILEKLGAPSRTAAVNTARERGILRG